MKLLKPAWVNHNGQPIFSVDIHPDGSRFATGGQGEDTGMIIVWNMAPVRNEADEKDESVPRVLCQMDNHLACVNCVRWSRSGRYLGSGGDDKLVMIWQTSKYGVGGTMFGSDSKIVESWRPVHTLRGHTGDVLDVAWSPSDVWFASCSIDNTVIVWNAEKFPEQVAVLRGHTGLVKGITWDPVGKYLASQSDDKSLRVWRTRDWQQEACITEPFKECGGTTHVLRCDWSPDGHYVVSAHAMNNSGPTAQIVERGGWKTSLDFVGHRKAITVVRFNPDILSKKLKKDALKPKQYTCCAIGSRDRSLSIWLTALKRPLVVTHELFTNSILDISWGQNGTELLCSSCDGTVAYLEFKQEEIGTPLAKADVGQLLEKIYGKHITQNKNATGNQVIESAAILNLQQQQKVSPPRTGMIDSASRSSLQWTPSKSNSMFNGKELGDSPFKPTDKQIETKTADGKRRITPIFLSCQPDVGDLPVPFSHKISFDSSKQASSIQIEKQDKVTHSGLTSPPSRPRSLTSPPAREPAPKAADNKSPGGEEWKLSASRPRSPTTDKQQLSMQPLVALEKTPRPGVASPERLSEKPATDKAKATSSLSLKRKLDKDRDTDQPKKRGRPRHMMDKDKERPRPTTPYNTPALPPVQHQSPVASLREPVRYTAAVSGLQLPVPIIEKHHSRQISRGAGDGSLALVVENHAQGGATPLHKLQCTQAGTVIWEQVLSSRILAVAGTSTFAACGCEDGSLSLFNAIGQKLFPNLCLSTPISVLEASGHFLMAITSSGSLHVWNMQTNSGIIRNEQLSGLLKGDDQIQRATVTRDGIPVITLTDSRSFSYSTDMACWLLMHDKRDQLQYCSDHRTSKPSGNSRLSGTLASLQLTQERSAAPASVAFQAGQNLKQLSTLNHLETQVAAALSLKSGTEYRFWLETYIRYLVQEGVEARLREVCNDLLGPVYRSTSGALSWSKTILGINKREFLKEILPYFGTNLSMQRLYTEIQEQLDTAIT